MPITFAVPPAGVATTLAETLPELGRSSAIEMRAPAITEAAGRFALGDQLRVARTLDEVAASDAIATPVYVVGLDQIIAGHVVAGAKLALWAHIMPTTAGAVSAEVSAVDTKFAQISNGVAIGRFRNVVTRLATEESPAADGEIAQLRIPALNVTLLWLRKAGADVFEPVEVSSPACVSAPTTPKKNWQRRCWPKPPHANPARATADLYHRVARHGRLRQGWRSLPID